MSDIINFFFYCSIGKITIEYVQDAFYSDNQCATFQSLAGWTFSLGSYYGQNITKYLDNIYFQLMAVIVDPYCISVLLIVSTRLSVSYFSLF